MTVCISAFAAKSKAIVLVADKMLTYDAYGSAPMQSDTGVRKILHLGTSGWEALFAGDGAFAEKVVNQATVAIQNKPTIADSCQEMMDCVRDSYQTIRERDLTDTVLRPRLLDKESFLKRGQDVQPLDEVLSRDVAERLVKYRTECDMMICGFDRVGPHIFTVQDTGVPSSCDLPGFCAIGIGGDSATSRLLWEEVDRNDQLAKVLYDTFHAKVQAEIIQGVGYLWDAHVIVAGKKLAQVKRPVMRAIEELFEDAMLSPFDKLKRRPDARRKKWTSAVETFSKDALEDKRARRKGKVITLKSMPPKTA